MIGRIRAYIVASRLVAYVAARREALRAEPAWDAYDRWAAHSDD